MTTPVFYELVYRTGGHRMFRWHLVPGPYSWAEAVARKAQLAQMGYLSIIQPVGTTRHQGLPLTFEPVSGSQEVANSP